MCATLTQETGDRATSRPELEHARPVEPVKVSQQVVTLGREMVLARPVGDLRDQLARHRGEVGRFGEELQQALLNGLTVRVGERLILGVKAHPGAFVENKLPKGQLRRVDAPCFRPRLNRVLPGAQET